jgi:hypothetical protein
MPMLVPDPENAFLDDDLVAILFELTQADDVRC